VGSWMLLSSEYIVEKLRSTSSAVSTNVSPGFPA
jgi:hypothetical protein